MERQLHSFFNDESAKIYEIFFEELSEVLNFPYEKQSEFMEYFWGKFEDYQKRFRREHGHNINNSLPGSVFEKLFEILLYLEDIPIYQMNENFKDVQFVKPDFLLLTNEDFYIFLSLKVSLRERWKQADWEARLFKEKEINTKSILITLNERECESLVDKLYFLRGLDEAILATGESFNYLFSYLKKFTYKVR